MEQSVQHSGVREALLAPVVDSALPDAGRSSSRGREDQDAPAYMEQSVQHSGFSRGNGVPASN